MSNAFNFDDDDDDRDTRPRSRSRRRDDDDDRDDRPRSPRRDDNNDYDDPPPPRRRGPDRSKSRSSPLRFITPGTFGMAVLLFFLPWTDLSCNGPTGRMQLATQSGLQSAIGEASEGDGIARQREEQERLTGKKANNKLDFGELRRDPLQKGAAGKKDDGPEKAFLLWPYFLILIAGAIVPVLLAANLMRGVAVLGFSGVAILLLVIQLLIGFPLANAAADMNAEIKKTAGPAKQAGMMDAKLDMQIGGMMEMKCSYLPSFWITFLMLIASGALGLVQVIQGAPKAARGKTYRRPRDDPDDEDDDRD